MELMKIIIIPARGGSKGIPKKNLKKVGGMTLVRRAVLASLGSKADLVIFSTDDGEISNEVEGLNAVIHHRSCENSNDTATSESVIVEVIKDLGSEWPQDALIAMVQVTSPFTTSEIIDECFNVASKGFTGFTAVHSHKLIWRDSSTGWQPINHPPNHRPRRQEMMKEVYETGAVYAFQLGAFMDSRYRFCSPALPLIVNEMRSIDIDSLEDLMYAELIHEHLKILTSPETEK